MMRPTLFCQKTLKSINFDEVPKLVLLLFEQLFYLYNVLVYKIADHLLYLLQRESNIKMICPSHLRKLSNCFGLLSFCNGLSSNFIIKCWIWWSCNLVLLKHPVSLFIVRLNCQTLSEIINIVDKQKIIVTNCQKSQSSQVSRVSLCRSKVKVKCRLLNCSGFATLKCKYCSRSLGLQIGVKLILQFYFSFVECISWLHPPTRPDLKLPLWVKVASFDQFCHEAFKVKYKVEVIRMQGTELFNDLNHFENLCVGKVWGFFLLLHHFLRCWLHLVEPRLPWQENTDTFSGPLFT